MAFSRAQWAIDLLHAIGNLRPSPDTIRFIIGWTKAEQGGPFGAQFNLLNTTQRAPGSWNFNVLNKVTGFGVQNYPTYKEGIQANAQVLQNGLYGPLLQALRTNDTTALGIKTGRPSAGVIKGLETWSGSRNISGYLRNIYNNLGAGSQMVQSKSGTTSGGGSSGGGSSGGGSSGGGSSGGGVPNICDVPGAVLLFPTCAGIATGQAIGGAASSAGSAAGNALSQTIADVLAGVGSAFVHALGGKSAADLGQRAALVGGGIVLFFIGVGILFFAHKDTAFKIAGAAVTGGESLEAEGASGAAESYGPGPLRRSIKTSNARARET